MMNDLFSSGHAADIVLVVLAIEALWLKSRGMAFATILSALLPAAFIILALRAALTGVDWPYIAVPLALSFPIHMLDMRFRMRRGKDVNDS
jgi:hypothetical protein